MTDGSEDRFVLDEQEHQVLDTLDSLPLGSLWTAARGHRDEVLAQFEAAVVDAGEDVGEVEAAIAAAHLLFGRLVALMAERLLDASAELAATDDRGGLEPDAIARARAALNESPELAPALASAVEAVGVSLGLDRESLAWAVLVELGERCESNELLRGQSLAIAERLSAAQVSAPSRALRVFRSAAVRAAGPEVRARFLALEHPEHLALARALVGAFGDPATLVDRFDAAVAALADAKSGQAPSPSPEAAIDGPKRKFTKVHLVLALIVLALTVWHYWFR